MKVMESVKMKNTVEKQEMPRLFQLWDKILNGSDEEIKNGKENKK